MHPLQHFRPPRATGRTEAVKWKDSKVVFCREAHGWWSPSVRLGEPQAFNLIAHPKEPPQTRRAPNQGSLRRRLPIRSRSP